MAQRETVRGACPHDCPDTCAMLYEVEDGRLRGVRGDPAHPYTRGGLCIKLNDYEKRVYSDRRLLYPLKRSGPKGSGAFERISWEEALAWVGRRWRAIIAEDGAPAILPLSFLGTMGLLNGLNVGDAFFNRLGASVAERSFCASGLGTGYALTLGTTPGTDPEHFAAARCILLWASNPISTNLHLWPFIAQAQRNGATVVVIDPVKTRTAKKADWHLPLRPGSDAALGLGLIHVLIEEDLLDHDYIARHTLGFEGLARRAAAFPPERVADLTAIAAADIRRLARLYARTPPAVIRAGVALERSANGGNAMRAIACLPALVGAWRHRGGGLLVNPEYAFPIDWDAALRPDWIAPETRVINCWTLGSALTGEMGLDPPIRSLMVYNANPALVVPEQEKVLRGLAREDLFTVVSEQFLTDTARYADLVLPATTQAEQFDVMTSWGHLYLTINEPAIAPRGEAVPNTELFRRLARTMGFDDPFWRRSDEAMARDLVRWDDPALAGVSFEDLRARGFVRLKTEPADGTPLHAHGNFPTPSGKCEFESSLAEKGDFVFATLRQGSEAFQPGGVLDPLPDFVAPPEADEDSAHPLRFISPKSHAFINSSFANMPEKLHHAGEQHVLINPRDAAQRNIGDGSPVRVFNRNGAFAARARVSEEVMPGLVSAPMGYWRKEGANARTVGAVNKPGFADLGRAPLFSDTRVEVAPLED